MLGRVPFARLRSMSRPRTSPVRTVGCGPCPVPTRFRLIPYPRTVPARALSPHGSGLCPVPARFRLIPCPRTVPVRTLSPHGSDSCPVPALFRSVCPQIVCVSMETLLFYLLTGTSVTFRRSRVIESFSSDSWILRSPRDRSLLCLTYSVSGTGVPRAQVFICMRPRRSVRHRPTPISQSSVYLLPPFPLALSLPFFLSVPVCPSLPPLCLSPFFSVSMSVPSFSL